MSSAQGQVDPLVTLEGVSVAFNGRTVLKSVALQLMPGEIVTLVGPNGAGKTTLVKILVGLLKPASGTRKIAAKTKIGYMPQKLAFDPILPLTARQFLALGPGLESEGSLFETVGITKILDTQLASLSGGELQRVLLARALLSKPDILVLDEPSRGIDILGQSDLYKLLKQVKLSEQCGIVMVSHDLYFVMAETDRVICLNQHICCAGRPETVTRDPAFLSLFGEAVHGLALYTHHHDHRHTEEGESE